ncbi:MAG: hypothetical protein EON98_07305 [Chitinophagaceae bacterium]|nr:MAG: hypothetical protein EON98_07305 [Chitinophagaceae bacterium]
MCSYHGTTANPFHGPAIVLIDEIELHLHPKWQRKIVGYLSKKFPNTQFIATTNSPVIVQAALEANLVLLKRKGPQVVVDNHPDVMKNWRIDQILTSDLFGLTSVRSEKAEKIMTQRRNLLLKPKLTKTEKAKLATLEKRIDYVPVAETPEYIQAMQIIRSSSEKMS